MNQAENPRWIAVLGILLASVLAMTQVRAVEIGYRDDDGGWKVIDSDAFPQSGNEGKGRFTYKQAGGVTFSVTYLDVTNGNGIGFDDPVNGASYRAITQAVFEYISGVFDETGSCDVRFEESYTSGTGFLASAGTFYFTDPGYKNGFAFTHITTGDDPLLNVPDLRSRVDFGYDWHASLALPVLADHYDFFSVILHEITHGLGIADLTDFKGQPELAPGVLTVFDNYLYTGNGTKLWNAAGVFQSTEAALEGGDGGVFYRGPKGVLEFGSFIPIFAPDEYTTGSSITHWNTGLDPEPVMDPNIAATQVKREYIGFELAVFEDLGYRLRRENRSRHWVVFE